MPVTVVFVFWASCACVLYPYIGYPALLWLAQRFGLGVGDDPEDAVRRSWPDERLPTLTLIVSAFNEAAIIERKLDNARGLDYPHDALEILVISDGSTDATAEIVRRHARVDERVHLIEMDRQSGKSLGLNRAVPEAKGELIVFSDANALYEHDALKRLIAPFADASVGYTVGSALYRAEDQEAVNVSEGLYWRYELWIKRMESAFYSVVGGDGAIYAIRRELFRPLAAHDISDFVNPMQIIAAGFRGVFQADARSHEGGTEGFADEFRRKRRIVNRSFGAVRRHIGLFSPGRDTRFLFMLLSHKVIRWFSGALVLLALASGTVLVLNGAGLPHALAFAGILLSVAIAIVGWHMDRTGRDTPRLVYLVYYFHLVGLAGLLGIIDDLRGRSYATWRHGR